MAITDDLEQEDQRLDAQTARGLGRADTDRAETDVVSQPSSSEDLANRREPAPRRRLPTDRSRDSSWPTAAALEAPGVSLHPPPRAGYQWENGTTSAPATSFQPSSLSLDASPTRVMDAPATAPAATCAFVNLSSAAATVALKIRLLRKHVPPGVDGSQCGEP